MSLLTWRHSRSTLVYLAGTLIWESMSGRELHLRVICGPVEDHIRRVQVRSFGSAPTSHMNKTVHTLTTATIMKEFSGKGAGG